MSEREKLIYRLIVFVVIVIAVLFLFRTCYETPFRIADKTIYAVDKAGKLFTKYLGTKDAFDATFGPIVSEQRFRRLQFFQRNQVCLFRIVRYRGKDHKTHDYVEFYKKESDKKDIKSLPIVAKQYCEWQAKGTFEFNFYIDMGDLSKWQHKWDPKNFVLTLYPPDIETNTPAELEPLVYTCIADSITIDEDFTKQQLEKKIPELKSALAYDQKRFMYYEAKNAIIEHYKQFFKLIPNLKVEKFPQIEVIFPHEIKIDKDKL